MGEPVLPRTLLYRCWIKSSSYPASGTHACSKRPYAIISRANASGVAIVTKMDIVFVFQGVEFEWDGDKASGNLRKHGVTFEEAAETFFDPFYQEGDTSTDTENRDFILGYSWSQHLLLVVCVERGKRTRIISARLATRSERKLYEGD